jgi:hypothetical protein
LQTIKEAGMVCGMKSATARKSALEKKLSGIVGASVEITVRNLRDFTISAEGDARAAMESAKSFLSLTGQIVNWSVSFDAECDYTCAYFSVAA